MMIFQPLWDGLPWQEEKKMFIMVCSEVDCRACAMPGFLAAPQHVGFCCWLIAVQYVDSSAGQAWQCSALFHVDGGSFFHVSQGLRLHQVHPVRFTGSQGRAKLLATLPIFGTA